MRGLKGPKPRRDNGHDNCGLCCSLSYPSFLSGLSWYICLLIALVVSPLCGLVELISWRGTDTVTVPLATAALVFPGRFVLLFGMVAGLQKDSQ